MRPENFNIMTIIHACVGSYEISDSLDEIVERLYPDMDWMMDCTSEELKTFDSIVFQCQLCGYWYRQENRNLNNEDEWTCKECSD